MSFRLTGILVLVLAVLGGVVWFTEFRDKGSATPATADKQRPDILKFDDQAAQRLEVTRADQKVSAERTESGDWTLQPSGEPGDRLRISSVLLRLAALQANRKIADAPTDLAQYGLDKPSLTVAVTLKDGTAYSLLMGGKAPSDSSTYVQAGGDPAVYLIPNTLVSDVDRLVTDPPIQRPTPTPAPIPPPPSPEASPSPTP